MGSRNSHSSSRKESDENPSPHVAPEIEHHSHDHSHEIQEAGCDSGCCEPKDTTIIQGENSESAAWEMSGKPDKQCCSLIDNYCSCDGKNPVSSPIIPLAMRLVFSL